MTQTAPFNHNHRLTISGAYLAEEWDILDDVIVADHQGEDRYKYEEAVCRLRNKRLLYTRDILC